MNTLKLLEVSGQLIKAIDDCTDWFVESRWECDPDKRHIFNAVYETKVRRYKQALEEVYAKLF